MPTPEEYEKQIAWLKRKVEALKKYAHQRAAKMYQKGFAYGRKAERRALIQESKKAITWDRSKWPIR